MKQDVPSFCKQEALVDPVQFDELVRHRLAHTNPESAMEEGDHALNRNLDFSMFEAKKPIAAAVLIGVVPRADSLNVIFTKRSTQMKSHSGQVSFPGGKIDGVDESVVAGALREAHEEVALAPTAVTVIGQLPDYYSGSGFRITPVIGLVQNEVELVANPGEVEEIFEVPLQFLMNPENNKTDCKEFRGQNVRYYKIQWERHMIWGVTAGILNVLRRKVFS